MLNFLISLYIEIIIYWLFFESEKYKSDLIHFIAVIIALNLLTQPIFIFILPLLNLNYVYFLIISELFIIIIEGFFFYYSYKKINIKKCFLASFIANIFSWQFTPFILALLVMLK